MRVSRVVGSCSSMRRIGRTRVCLLVKEGRDRRTQLSLCLGRGRGGRRGVRSVKRVSVLGMEEEVCEVEERRVKSSSECSDISFGKIVR